MSNNEGVFTNAVTTAYDAEGHVVSQRGTTYPVDYSYDEFGDKVSMTTYRGVNAAGDVTRWLRDEATGLVTNKVYADGKGPTYTYTPDGKLATRIWARGIATTYSYDANGALTNTVYSDGTPTISLAYNRAGRQIEAHDAAGVTTFLYDDFGAVTNEMVIGVAGTNTIERFYGNFGRSLGYSLNGVRQSTLAYDPATGRLATMLANGSDTPFTWNYADGSNLKSSLAYPNGLTATWQYDANGQLLQVCNSSPTNIISQYDYVYDAVGRRVEISRSGSAMSEPRTDVYGYNVRNELISAAKSGGSSSSSIEYAYQYDDIGNRMTSLDLGTNRTYIANNLNQYTSISNSAFSASPREAFIPQFDDGNQTLIKTATGIWQVQYNGENRPVQWSLVNSSTPNSSTLPLISMSYDRMGRRVTKNGQRFVYDGYLQIADNNDNVYVWDPTEPVATRPLVWNRSTSVAYYTHDCNKNVSEVVAENGDVAAHYEHAPFGTVTAQCGTSSAANPWRFSSEYAEDDTATVCYSYKHYEATQGRWVSRDPTEEQMDFKLYVFVGNIGINSVDVLGLFDDGGGQQVCDEWEWSFVPQPPPMAPVWIRKCVRYRTIRGHKDFANNGTKCPFDYTKEDHSAGSSPFAPWGLWRHFRAAEDIVPELEDAISKCDADMFQSRMHQLQDTQTHYNRGWRWWTAGHLFGGSSPDHDEYAQKTAWDLAQKDTERYVKMWNEKCRLANECNCEWERR